MTKKNGRSLSIVLYVMGAITGLLFAGSIIWANFELPFFFDYSYASVSSQNQIHIDLDCPIFLTTNETSAVRTFITNNTDKTLNPVFRGEISYMGGIAREVEYKPTILPGESSPIEIKINSDDIVFNFMILARTYQLPTYKTPAQSGSCAVVMLPITFLSGDQVYYLLFFIIVLLLAAGISLWVKFNHPLKGLSRKVFNVMSLLAILLLAAIFCGITDGWMIPGFLMLVLIVLLMMVAIVYFGASPQDNEY